MTNFRESGLSSLVEDRLPASTESGQPKRRPKVSILVVTYNHVKYIGQALDSILTQKTEYDYVIHVLEDCSTDGTQDVVMRYAREHPGIVKPFLNPRNLGRRKPPAKGKLNTPSKELQKCFYQRLTELDGDYIAILEGDDYWSSPLKLQNQVSFLEFSSGFCGACLQHREDLRGWQQQRTAPVSLLGGSYQRGTHDPRFCEYEGFFSSFGDPLSQCIQEKSPSWF